MIYQPEHIERRVYIVNTKNKLLTYFHRLAMAKQVADEQGQEIIASEMKRIRKKYLKYEENKNDNRA